jgi:hypothetical protein
MKKILFGLVSIVVMFAGCKSAPKPGPAVPEPERVQKGADAIKDENVPAWLNEFPPKGYFWGIGTSKSAVTSLAMETAELLARQELARQLDSLAQGAIEQHAQDSGTLNERAVTEFKQSVSRNITNLRLSGVVPINRWLAPNGSWWYRVQIQTNQALKLAGEAIEDSMVANESALWAEFKKEQAVKQMEKLLEENYPEPAIASDYNRE